MSKSRRIVGVAVLVFCLSSAAFAASAGDANGDNSVTVADVFYLVNFLFAGGPAPAAASSGLSLPFDGSASLPNGFVFRIVNSATTGAGNAISALSNSIDGVALVGIHLPTGNYAMLGRRQNAVFASVPANGQDLSSAVFAETSVPTSLTSSAVLASHAATGHLANIATKYGAVEGFATNYSGGPTGGTGIGGSNGGSNSVGWAGYFNGRVGVNGVLSKAAGSFKIDHPLDPENKYLSHSFVESPDMMNVYNGNVVLNAAGDAWVQMPEYFEALNREFRYQLTAVGAPGPNLYVAQEISGNRFKIAGGTPRGKVSWQVTGVRRDQFAEANRIPVEEEKPYEVRGTYLHPKEFGKSVDRGETARHERERAALDSVRAARISKQ